MLVDTLTSAYLVLDRQVDEQDTCHRNMYTFDIDRNMESFYVWWESPLATGEAHLQYIVLETVAQTVWQIWMSKFGYLQITAIHLSNYDLINGEAVDVLFFHAAFQQVTKKTAYELGS